MGPYLAMLESQTFRTSFDGADTLSFDGADTLSFVEADASFDRADTSFGGTDGTESEKNDCACKISIFDHRP